MNEKEMSIECAVTEIPLSVVRLSGNDRSKFLHNFCTADIKELGAGRCCEAFFLNPKGKTICHGIVISREVDLLIVTTAADPTALMESLDMYLLSDDVTISNDSEVWICNFVYGSKHEAVLDSCEIRVAGEGTVVSLGFQFALPAELAGDGVLILTPAEGDVDVRKQLVDCGAVEFSLEQLHLIRVKNQTPWCGSEVTDACLAQEFRRDSKAISFTKGCYLGQETVARLDALGHVNRYLAGFEIVDGAAEAGDEVRLEGKKIGVVTSTAKDAGGVIYGLGFLRVQFTKPGSEIECENAKLLVR